jgi:hypothetical protein
VHGRLRLRSDSSFLDNSSWYQSLIPGRSAFFSDMNSDGCVRNSGRICPEFRAGMSGNPDACVRNSGLISHEFQTNMAGIPDGRTSVPDRLCMECDAPGPSPGAYQDSIHSIGFQKKNSHLKNSEYPGQTSCGTCQLHWNNSALHAHYLSGRTRRPQAGRR